VSFSIDEQEGSQVLDQPTWDTVYAFQIVDRRPVRSAGDVERENVRTHDAPPSVVEMRLVVQDGFEPSIAGS
jgi:hypothetical protein